MDNQRQALPSQMARNLQPTHMLLEASADEPKYVHLLSDDGNLVKFVWQGTSYATPKKYIQTLDILACAPDPTIV